MYTLPLTLSNLSNRLWYYMIDELLLSAFFLDVELQRFLFKKGIYHLYMHTHTSNLIHSSIVRTNFIQACINKYKHTHIYTYMHIYTIHRYIQVIIYTYSNAYMYAYCNAMLLLTHVDVCMQ